MVSTVRESINGGLNSKTNQKARYWDDAACFFRRRRGGDALTAEPKLCVSCVERVHVYMVSR